MDRGKGKKQRKRLHEQITQDQHAQPSGKSLKERSRTEEDKVSIIEYKERVPLGVAACILWRKEGYCKSIVATPGGILAEYYI